MADTESIAHLSDDLQVEIANLSEEGQAQVYEAIEAASDVHGHVAGEDVEHAIEHAQEADVHREAAVEHQREQADAADRGDYETAHQHAVDAEYHIQAVADLGGEDHTTAQNAEVAHLEWAEHHQEIANENAVAAADYADLGDMDHAQMHADMAVDHAETASYQADLGDHGGHYGQTSSTTDTSTTE